MAVYLLRENYRDIRYRIDHARVSWALKWYSTSKNPRVVASRISDGPLLSLRTFPQDPYLQKPGKFLKLTRIDFTGVQENEYNVVPDDMEEENEGIKEEEGNELLKNKNRTKGATLEAPIGSEQQSLLQRSILQPSLRSKLILRLQQISHDWGKIGSGKEEGPIEFGATDNTRSCPILPARPFSEGYDGPGSRSSAVQAAWKSITSGVSVSAARISTGHSAPTSRDFEVLSGDFIQAELRNDDDKGTIRDGPRYMDAYCLLDLLFMDEDDDSAYDQHQFLELYIE